MFPFMISHVHDAILILKLRKTDPRADTNTESQYVEWGMYMFDQI